MPLLPGDDPEAIKSNIKELMATGRARPQAVAIALRYADETKIAEWEEDFTSAHVSRYRYDVKNKELQVEFHNGKVYKYSMSQDTYDELQASDSKGEFVWEYLR